MTTQEIINILVENNVYTGSHPVILTIIPVKDSMFRKYTCCIMTLSEETDTINIFPLVGAFKLKYEKGYENHAHVNDIENFKFYRYDLFLAKAFSFHIRDGVWYEFDYKYNESDHPDQKN